MLALSNRALSSSYVPVLVHFCQIFSVELRQGDQFRVGLDLSFNKTESYTDIDLLV